MTAGALRVTGGPTRRPRFLSVLGRRFGEALVAERERWPLWSPVFFGAGIVIYFGLSAQPPVWLGPVLTGVALAGVLAGRRWPNSMPLLLALMLVAAGFAVAGIRTVAVAAPILERSFGPATVSGRVIAIEDLATGPRIVLDRVQLSRLDADATPRRVRLRLHRDSNVAIGDRIAVLARLDPPPEPSAPGAYDFRMHAWFAGIGGVGFALGKPKAAEAGDVPTGFVDGVATGLADLRRAIGLKIRAVLPGDVGAVAAALIVGERSAIEPAAMDAIRISGLAHLLSISGLHMGLVAGTIFFAVRAVLALSERMALRYPIKKYAAAVAMLGAFLYLLLSGATVPTQRSFMMTAMVLTAVLLDREAISMRLVAWAAMIVLCFAPESVLGPSFQMSFAAVVALVALYESVRMRHLMGAGAGTRWFGRAAIYLAGVGLTTLVAGIATSLYGVHHFGELAHYSMVANLLAVPLCGIWIMPWAVVASLLMPVGLESLGLVPMGWGVEVVLWIARTVAGWPGASTQIPLMPGWGTIIATLGGLWLCLWRSRWRYAGLVGLALGIASIAATPRPDILVAGSGKLVGLRLGGSDALAVSTLRAERYAAEMWMRELGLTAQQSWTASEPAASCDVVGCILRYKGRRIAVAFAADALVDDCTVADVVIALEPVRHPCPSAALLIDRFDLWRNGAHAIWLDDLAVATVRQRAGAWPWTAPARRGREEHARDGEADEDQ